MSLEVDFFQPWYLEFPSIFLLERVWLQWGTRFREVEQSHYNNEKKIKPTSFGKISGYIGASSYIYPVQRTLGQWLDGTGLINVQSFNTATYVTVCL